MYRLLALAGLLLLAPASLAQSPLFTPLDGARTAADGLALDRLSQEVGIAETALVRADVAALDAPSVALALFGETYAFERTDVHRRSADDWTWIGRKGSDVAVFVVRSGRLTGAVWANGDAFEVRPAGGDAHAIGRVDPSRVPESQTDEMPVPAEALGAPTAATPLPPTASASAAATTIDLIAVYTAEHASGYLDAIAPIQLSVDIANIAFQNSGIDAEVKLVYAYESSTPATTSASADLGALQSTTDGRFDEVHALRDAYGADLVAIFGSKGNDYGLCGLGYVNAPPTYAFTLIASDCSGTSLTLAHEIGHNAGSSHDPYVNTGTLAYAYGQGTVDTAGRWRTVMAYNNQCSDAGYNCTSIPFWSSPTLNYDDTSDPEHDGPTGDASTRDNVRLWGERMATLAAFRTRPSGPAAVSVSPTSLSLSLGATETATRTITIENTANAGAYPLSWRTASASLMENGTDRGTPCATGQPFSQTEISYYTNTTDGSGERGQSFKPPCSGRLLSISPWIYVPADQVGSTWSATLRLYEGEGTTGTELSATPLTFTNAASRVYEPTYTLDTPLDVTPGDVFTWYLDVTTGTVPVLYSENNPYADGQVYRGTSAATAAAIAAHDMTFGMKLDPPDQLWYALASSAGSANPGASSSLDLTFDATGITPGTHSVQLVLSTNDPAMPTVTVPVSVTILPVANEADGPDATWLGLPTPNPSSGAATVSYRLAEAGAVRLAVVDLLGREVAVVVDGTQSAGDARATLPSDLAPGVYLVRLTTADTALTRRVVVAR